MNSQAPLGSVTKAARDLPGRQHHPWLHPAFPAPAPGSVSWGREHSLLQSSPEAGYLCGFLMKGARTPWLLPQGYFFISQGCFFTSQGLPSGHEDSWVSLAMVSQGGLAEGFASHPLYAPDLSLQTLMETSSYKSVSKLMGALAQSLKPSDEEQVSLGPSRPLFES